MQAPLRKLTKRKMGQFHLETQQLIKHYFCFIPLSLGGKYIDIGLKQSSKLDESPNKNVCEQRMNFSFLKIEKNINFTEIKYTCNFSFAQNECNMQINKK